MRQSEPKTTPASSTGTSRRGLARMGAAAFVATALASSLTLRKPKGRRLSELASAIKGAMPADALRGLSREQQDLLASNVTRSLLEQSTAKQIFARLSYSEYKHIAVA
jgi:hypothetical protein